MSHHNSGKPPPPAAAIGNKTARPCDSCVRRRARYFCAADDAFLCHPCDQLVHSANPLARRHRRLPLPSSSHPPAAAANFPSWHRGFKRKPRTPRPHHKPLVPEIDNSIEEDEEEEDDVKKRFCRVPEFEPTEMDLAEFAADMESLLGGEEEVGMEELGLGERKEVEVKEEKGEELVGLEKEGVCKGMGLRLDYDAVTEAWTSTGCSPWMAGERPRAGVDDYWLECLVCSLMLLVEVVN